MPELRQTTFNEVPGESPVAPNEPHLACALLLDTSGSMSGDPIESLNKAINDFKEKTSMDELAKKRVDVAIIEFNDTARVVQDFTPLTQLQPVTLSATGCTAMGAGINLAIDKVKERSHLYDSLGTPRYQPWIVMITDGAPTDDISAARQRILDEENRGSRGRLKFWALGVPGYSPEVLKSLTKRCMALTDKDFTGFFDWMSDSISIVSASRIDENVQYTDLPENVHRIPEDW